MDRAVDVRKKIEREERGRERRYNKKYTEKESLLIISENEEKNNLKRIHTYICM